MLLDAEWRPRTVWRFEAVLVLLGGKLAPARAAVRALAARRLQQPWLEP